jgi:hypothetical protein
MSPLAMWLWSGAVGWVIDNGVFLESTPATATHLKLIRSGNLGAVRNNSTYSCCRKVHFCTNRNGSATKRAPQEQTFVNDVARHH